MSPLIFIFRKDQINKESMAEIKLIEIGAEGGGLEFYAIITGSKTKYVIGSNRKENYETLYDMLISYTKKHDPLLWYYPVDVDPDIIEKLVPILLNEYLSHPKGQFMNLERWEEILGVRFEELSNAGTQTFKITPVQKIETYNYNHFGDERVLESVTTEYSNKPNQKRFVMGVGTVEDNALVIRDRNSVILGVFPLQRYEVDVFNE